MVRSRVSTSRDLATHRPAFPPARSPVRSSVARIAVLAALAEKDEHARVLKLAVREMPRSGKPEELLNAYGIDAEHIAAAVRQLVGSEVTTS